VPAGTAQAPALGLEQSAEEAHSGQKAAALNGYDQINGVEITLAEEATAQVCAGIDRCVEFPAQGAEKSQVAFDPFGGQVEDLAQQSFHGHFIAQAHKEFSAVELLHWVPPLGQFEFGHCLIHQLGGDLFQIL